MTDALRRPLTITYWKSRFSEKPLKTETKSLLDLAREAAKTSAKTKVGLPLFKLAAFGDFVQKKSLRNNRNIIAIDGVEVDYDGEEIALSRAVETFRENGLAAYVYTTPSHAADRPRWRAVLPASEPLSPDQRDFLVARVNGLFEGKLSPESFTRAQIMYMGTALDGSPMQAETVNGRYVDAADDSLDAGALDKHGNKWGAERVREKAEPLADKARAFESVDEARSWVMAINRPEFFCERQKWYQVGMALHYEFDGSEDAYSLFVDWSATCEAHGETFDEEECRGRWESFSDRPGGLTGASLRKWAQECLGVEFTPPATAVEFEDLGDSTDPSPSESGFVRAHEFSGHDDSSDFLEGLMFDNSVMVLFGPPGIGKTATVAPLAAAIATATPWRGLQTEQRNVGILALEGQSLMVDRLRGHCERNGLRLEDLPVFVHRLASVNLRDDKKTLRRIIADLKGADVKLLIVDTLSRAMAGGDESSSKDAGSLIKNADEIRAATGCAVLFVGHTGKDVEKGHRGWSGIKGAADLEIECKDGGRDEADRKTMHMGVTKNRRGMDGQKFAWALETHHLAGRTNKWGRPVTTVVVEPVEMPKGSGLSNVEISKVLEQINGGGAGDGANLKPEPNCSASKNASWWAGLAVLKALGVADAESAENRKTAADILENLEKDGYLAKGEEKSERTRRRPQPIFKVAKWPTADFEDLDQGDEFLD